jgi:hypothetical protein
LISAILDLLAYVVLEIGDQLFNRRESVGLLLLSIVAVITLAQLVVVTDDALAGQAEEKRILQSVRTLVRRFGQQSNLDLDDMSGCQHHFPVSDK